MPRLAASGPRPCGRDGRPTPPAAASASSPRSSAPAADGAEISVSAIARAAGVDRSFLYRHHDLLAKIHALQAAPAADGQPSGPGVTRASLQADLAAAHERALRLTSRIRQLEHRLSEALGEQAWHESGLGIPADPGRLAQQNSHLSSRSSTCASSSKNETRTSPPHGSANRELMAQLNTPPRHR